MFSYGRPRSNRLWAMMDSLLGPAHKQRRPGPNRSWAMTDSLLGSNKANIGTTITDSPKPSRAEERKMNKPMTRAEIELAGNKRGNTWPRQQALRIHNSLGRITLRRLGAIFCSLWAAYF